MTEQQSQPLDKIMPAIAAAMGEVQKVGKEGRNTHDGYNFASIDNFLALVNPICARNGIVVSMQEGAIEDFIRKGKYGESAWMRMTWDVTVYHVSGQSLPTVSRTVEVLRNGAQAYGSSQSYALKQFLRSLFLIPTGDKDDADLAPTDEGTITHTSGRATPGPRQAKSEPAPETATQEAIGHAKTYIAEAETVDDVTARWKALPKHVRDHADVIDAAKAAKAAHTPADPIDADRIPYEGKNNHDHA